MFSKGNINISLLIAALICATLAKEMTDMEVLTSKPTKCTYEYVFEMYGAYCAGLRLTSMPSLRGGIEVLDFSDNKLHEIHGDTLSSYTSIKFLYLAENQLYEISEDAFASLTYLQTLDLSKNVIFYLPKSIFALPNLQNLYLSGNPLIQTSLQEIAIGPPIRAPLQHLDISECKINNLPEWGLLPHLAVYNISYNPILSMEPKHFATLCNLNKVDITMSIDKIALCDLKPAISWFQEKRIFFQLGDYNKLNSREYEKCPRSIIPDEYNVTHYNCKKEYLQVVNNKTPRRTWLTISGGLAGFLVGFILLLYLMHRRNVAQIKKKEHPKKPVPTSGDKNATAILLNNVSS